MRVFFGLELLLEYVISPFSLSRIPPATALRLNNQSLNQNILYLNSLLVHWSLYFKFVTLFAYSSLCLKLILFFALKY